jgi:hypothetical protein
VVRLFQASNVMFEDLGYAWWKEFCDNLVTFRGINDKAHN